MGTSAVRPSGTSTSEDHRPHGRLQELQLIRLRDTSHNSKISSSHSASSQPAHMAASTSMLKKLREELHRSIRPSHSNSLLRSHTSQIQPTPRLDTQLMPLTTSSTIA